MNDAVPPPSILAENAQPLNALRTRLNQKLLGKSEIVEAALTTLLAGGNLLLEDVPGVGKTTLAKHLAAAFTGTFQRIQFTSDILPMDVIGVQVYQRSTEKFDFKRGPVFANFLLADEINRAAPKTQSSLLQAMSEQRVTVDRETIALPTPFMVVATQNPASFEGTYPLPESQLDRFMMTLRIGYPNREAERQLLTNGPTPSTDLDEPVMSLENLVQLQERVTTVHCDGDLLTYVQDIIESTRESPELALGVSPRGALTLLRAARARALLNDRAFMVPDDIKALVGPCLAHRVVSARAQRNRGQSFEDNALILSSILSTIPVPS